MTHMDSDQSGGPWLEPFSLCPWFTCPGNRKCCEPDPEDPDGPCGCMENMHEMCGACCCCCCMFADNQMRAGLLAAADSSNLSEVRDTYCKQFFCRAVLCCPLGRCGYYSRARNAFRHKLDDAMPLKGSGCYLTWCFGCCTMIQEKRELDLRHRPRSTWRACGIPLPPNSSHKYCCCSFESLGRSTANSTALPPPQLKLQGPAAVHASMAVHANYQQGDAALGPEQVTMKEK